MSFFVLTVNAFSHHHRTALNLTRQSPGRRNTDQVFAGNVFRHGQNLRAEGQPKPCFGKPAAELGTAVSSWPEHMVETSRTRQIASTQSSISRARRHGLTEKGSQYLVGQPSGISLPIRE